MNEIKIEVSHRKSLNYSQTQNGIKTIGYIRIINETAEDFGTVILKTEFSPEFSKGTETEVNLSPNARIEIGNYDVSVNGEYLANIAEKVVGSILFSVIGKVKDEQGVETDKVLAETTETIEILPYNQWGGSSELPELLASFVMPNHPEVTGLLPLCVKQLEDWKRKPSITGYLTQDKNDAKYQMAAAYEVLKKQGIAYAVGQASFEEVGQKIRTMDEISAQKLGNCLDLSCFYASVLESMGLNPILILTKGHAYVGCWLIDCTFNNMAEDDSAALNKRCAEGIDEIMVVECTALTVGDNYSFEEAAQIAKQKLIDDNEFIFALDIKRCRGNRILPLPSRVFEEGSFKIVEFKTEKKEAEKPDELSTRGINAVATENVMTKQKMWERKLLDLSLRNPLINFRVTRSFIQIASADIARLEDILNSGDALSIEPYGKIDNVSADENKLYNISDIRDLLKSSEDDDYKAKRVQTFYDEKTLENSMKFLARQAKLSLEENGSNTLYLALGFLKWYENDLSVKERYAPLILVPVEIQKKIQDKTYRMKVRDEEAIINITLFEYLRQNFGIDIGGLDPLPADENGFDVLYVLNTVRKSIMSKSHWDVCDFAFLGIFSFARFIMWNDLKNRSEDILSNKVVKSLISGKPEWDIKISEEETANLDEKVKPADMAVVCSADESQMKAIRTSALGESFVLHGPPGTGKSQTITNMIANALYQGKSVLFVAEKMAALSVVQSRLEKVGLGPFCLELHSNKAQKQVVLSQLERTLETAGSKGSDYYEAKASELYELRLKLNDVVNELHKKTACNRSVYELIGDYENNKELDNKIILDNEFVEKTDEKTYGKILELTDEYYVIVSDIGDVREHPLKAFTFKEYSVDIRKEWAESLKKFDTELKLFKEEASKLYEALEAKTENGYKREVLVGFEEVLKKTPSLKSIPNELDTLEKYNLLKDEIAQRIEKEKETAELNGEILKQFKPDIFSYDCKNAKNRLIAAQGKWVLGKKMDINSLVKELRFISVNPSFVNENNLSEIYEKVEHFNELKKSLSDNETVTGIISTLTDNKPSDLKLAQERMTELGEFLKVCDRVKGLGNEFDITKVIDVQKDGFINAANDVCVSESKLISSYGFKLFEYEDEKDYAASVQRDIAIALDNEEEMRSYSALCETENKLAEFGLADAVNAVRNKEMYPAEIKLAFICNFGKTAAMKAVNESETLKGFNGASFNALIEKFKNLSDEFEDLTKKEAVARLSAGIPENAKDASASSEMGILQKSIKSGRRAMPIRKLFNEIPTLLRRICPCMLMSPISVAQYIDPSFPKFDLVIFDEASQLPTSEAVGVLARGENVIVVGDPKQLPPTSFFMTNQEEEDGFEFNDMESLLDDCLAISMPSRHLLWHYRSRHESLIAFSNMTYYDNELYTFPSPNDLVSEVKLVEVDGFYERGAKKVNKAEATAIVSEIMDRLRDPARRNDSIGVVTFSQVQQVFIEDMLSEELHKDPETALFAQGLEEGIFVKNLENVQGDERDIILFSVCYGPDENGKVSMNFGPLNQDGGWRRLNVAISRARKSMIIYSTLKPEQINLNATSALGVAGLKGFLEFAKLGKDALFVRNELVKKRNNEVAKAIRERLNKDGYVANLDIGSSEFHLDIAITDPDNPERYCLGILLDGENYYTGESARDRNVLQPSVLSGLGWRIHRVWTLDWFDTPEKEYEKIKEAIANSLRPLVEKETSEKVNAEETLTEEINEPDEEKLHKRRRELVLFSVNELGDAEDFYSPGHDKRIVREAESIMQTEAPISKTALVRKILSAYGVTKLTTKAEERIMFLLRDYPVQTTISAGETFMWLEDQNPTEYDIYRIPADSKFHRNIDEIPAEEIVNAVVEVMELNISMATIDCIKETGKIFGITKLSKALDSAVRVAISYGEQRGLLGISDDGEKITVIKE